MQIRSGTAGDHEKLVEIWLQSVRATHDFLTEEEIQALLPEVRDSALSQLELWVLCADEDIPIGFMGLVDSSLEGLFLSPDWIGRGGGKLLLEHARKLKGPLTVDVNEQNPSAIGFYEANGFEIVGRSETDDAGRPYPLLHMRERSP